MAFQLENDLSCPICFSIFSDPVVLSCSHSFCKVCLQTWWAEKLIQQCPLCKTKSSTSEPPCNLVLKNLCESFSRDVSLQQRSSSEAVCSLHSETLKLFCLDHQQPVCVICRDSKAHNNHRFRPIGEAAQDFREKLRRSLKTSRDKLDLFTQVEVNWDQTAEHIKAQAEHTERLIQKQFQQLQQFLQKEEEARIRAVREEEEQKSGLMKERMEALSREIAALSETIRATEEELRAADVSFLLSYTACVERARQRPLLEDLQLPSGALIDQAKHLGNLSFNIWNQMRDMVSYSPVVLDPNTAEAHLVVADDLTSVSHREKAELPRNPERFEDYLTVLGSEGFKSGIHSWDVEVRQEENWAVGVIGESVNRTGDILAGYWEIWFCNGKYRAYAPSLTDKVVSVKKPLRRIRAHLDWDRGKMSFCDPDNNTHLYTFSHTFTERLFPFINTQDTVPLRILPAEVCLKIL